MTTTAGPDGIRIQVAIDCADPHLLAAFWAAALRLEQEDHSERVEGLLAAGAITRDDVLERDGRLAFRTAAAVRDPAGRLPRLLFQQVPEPKSGKNRVHLDVHTSLGEGPEREAEVDRLVALGATRLWDGRQGPHTWVTLADPEGNELCLA